jgi:hypothetical protein
MGTSGVSGSGTGGKAASAAAFAVVLTAVALSLIGGVLAVQAVGSGAAVHTENVVPPAALGQDVPTSFGVVAVEYVERVAGPPAHTLGGSGRRAGTVPAAGESELSIAVALTNMRDRTLKYGPGQFRLRLGRGQSLAPTGANFEPGTLQPHAGIEGRVSFVVPKGLSPKAVEFRDRDRAVVIALRRLPQLTPQANHLHHLHHGSRR